MSKPKIIILIFLIWLLDLLLRENIGRKFELNRKINIMNTMLKQTITLLCIIVLCSCSDVPSQKSKYSIEDLKSRQTYLEELIAELEQSDPETAKTIKNSHESMMKGQADLMKLSPDLANDPEYITKQYEYTEALIRMMETTII